jgi:hypothetical protein
MRNCMALMAPSQCHNAGKIQRPRLWQCTRLPSVKYPIGQRCAFSSCSHRGNSQMDKGASGWMPSISPLPWCNYWPMRRAGLTSYPSSGLHRCMRCAGSGVVVWPGSDRCSVLVIIGVFKFLFVSYLRMQCLPLSRLSLHDIPSWAAVESSHVRRSMSSY